MPQPGGCLKPNVVIGGYFAFPYGGASAARMRNLALGLAENGANVHVIAMAPELQGYNEPRAGELSGECSFEHTAPFDRISVKDSSRMRTAGARLRWFLSFYGSIVPTLRILGQRIAKGRCDLFIGYGRNAALLVPLFALCKRRQIRTVLDVTEIHEQFSGTRSRLSPLYWDMRIGLTRLPQSSDVLTAITWGIKHRYELVGIRRTLVIPSIEGWDGLSPVPRNESTGPFNLVYVGALLPRDAPELLFETLRILRSRKVAVRLEIIGRYDRGLGRGMAELCRADPVLRECVDLVGNVDDKTLASRLRNADGLILLRRDTPAESHSFPTRLVEYLRQGRPVCVSDVGDISRYLRHAQDAMLVSPDDPVQVADAIQSVVCSEDRGYKLGVNGRERGATCFNRKVHASRLLEFVRGMDGGQSGARACS